MKKILLILMIIIFGFIFVGFQAMAESEDVAGFGIFDWVKNLYNKIGIANEIGGERVNSYVSNELANELLKRPLDRDLKIYTPFKVRNAKVTHGDFDFKQNTNIDFRRNSKGSLEITVKPTKDSVHRVEFDFEVPINLYARNFGLWYYLPYESMLSSQKARFNTFAIYLYTSNDGIFVVYPGRGYHAYEGWNYLIGNSFNGKFLTDNQLTDMQKVNTIRLHINKNNDVEQVPYKIYVDSFTTWEEVGIPIVRLEFDDGYRSVYKNAFPLMRERGMRGVVNVITKNLNKNMSSFITKEQLHEMHNAGWDIVSHSHTHPKVSEISNAQIFNELVISQQALLEAGFRNGPQFYVAPYGDNTPYAIEVAKQHYLNYRMTGYRKMDTVVPANAYKMEVLNMGSRGLEGAIKLIDDAVETGGFLPMMWHGEIGEEWNGVKWEIEEFEYLLDYLIEKGVEVVTYSDQFPETQIGN